MWKLIPRVWARQEAEEGGKHLGNVKSESLHTHLMPLLSEMPGSFLCDSAMIRDGSAVDR